MHEVQQFTKELAKVMSGEGETGPQHSWSPAPSSSNENAGANYRGNGSIDMSIALQNCEGNGDFVLELLQGMCKQHGKSKNGRSFERQTKGTWMARAFGGDPRICSSWMNALKR